MFTPLDKKMMQHALSLAAQGKNSASPNPRVGCVLTQTDTIVGAGLHLQAGLPHAEINALKQAGTQAIGATAYVTLEPCSHFGRTPPCVNALIEAGVKRVIIAMQDPNPLVSGQGLTQLKDANIEVAVGLLENEARQLNRGYLSRLERNRPFIRLKAAASLDGKTALKNGNSQWITSEAARLEVQHLRAESCAVLTGVATVIHDDPQMNVRAFSTPRQPKRIILDTTLRTPIHAAIFAANAADVWIATSEVRPKKLEPYLQKDVNIIQCRTLNQKIDLHDLLPKLATAGIGEIMIEAGAQVNGSFLYHNLVDEIILFQAAKIIGNSAQGLFKLPETLTDLAAASLWQFDEIKRIGADIRLTLSPK